MTIVRHEIRLGRIPFLIWTAAIGFMMVICIVMFPEMKGQMAGVSEVFASMGAFTAAFGMDRLSFGTFLGFYAVECGNILGLGGAFYAALTAASLLSKEEKDRTAEFLLTHPVRRGRVVLEKLAALVILITAMNLILYGMAVGTTAVIGETIPWKEMSLMHLAYYLLQLELGGIAFGISAVLRRGSAGVGIGMAVMMYFLNLLNNISDKAKWLRYITPFAYCEGADIVENVSLDGTLLAVGMALMLAGWAAAFLIYTKKDIR